MQKGRLFSVIFLALIVLGVLMVLSVNASIQILYNHPVSGSIDPVGDVDNYWFSGTAGDVVLITTNENSFDGWKTDNNQFDTLLRLYDQKGTKIAQSAIPFVNQIYCTLNETGDYTILVSDSDGTLTGTYGIVVNKLNNPQNTQPNIKFDQLVNASVSFLGDLNSYWFSGTAGDVVLITTNENSFDGWKTDNNQFDTLLRLYDPKGTEVANATHNYVSEISALLNQTGIYTLLVSDSDGTLTGTYTLLLQNLTHHTNDTAEPTSPAPTVKTMLATFTISQSNPKVNEPVTFNASGSFSSTGNITRYEWNFGDGTTQTAYDQIITHVFADEGPLNVTLTIFDESGEASEKSVKIEISPVAPVRDAVSAPLAIGAGVAAISTAAILGAASGKAPSTPQPSSNPPIDQSVISELPRSQLQKFLNFFTQKSIEPGKQKRITREILAVVASLAVMTVVFSYVEANGFPSVLDLNVLAVVIPSTFLSVCIVKASQIIIDASCSRKCGVQNRYTLWPLGIVTFVATGLLVLFPFAQPGTMQEFTDVPQPKKALLSFSKAMFLLALLAPFAVASMVGFGLVGDVALITILSSAFFSLVPISPLPGKHLFSYRKEVALTSFALVGVMLYGLILKVFPLTVYLIAGLIAAGLGVVGLYTIKKIKSLIQ